jgi:hypothetical protein
MIFLKNGHTFHVLFYILQPFIEIFEKKPV